MCEIEGVNGNGVVAGLFSGQIGFYGVDNVREQTSSIDDGALKTLKLLGSSRDDIYLLITGGISERLRVSTFRSVSGLECQLISDNEH